MRRLSFVISSALLLASGPNTLLAQHNGSHSTSGASHSHGAPASTINSSTLSNRNPMAGQLIYPTPIGLQHQYSGYTGINRGALPTNDRPGNRDSRGGNRYGYGYGAGYGAYVPYYVSTFDDSNYSGPWQYPAAHDAAAQTAEVNANLLGEQVAHLSAEVDSLRNERAAQQSAPVRPPYNAPPAMAEDDTPASTPVTIVLNSGKHLQVKSYAIMGQTIWDFSSQPAKRIDLSTVNLSASKIATEANGGEFPEIR